MQESFLTMLLQALENLTPRQREAVVLRYYFGQGDQQIATIVGCSYAAARQRVHDGLQALEQIIRRHYPMLLDGFTSAETTFSQAQEGARHGIA